MRFDSERVSRQESFNFFDPLQPHFRLHLFAIRFSFQISDSSKSGSPDLQFQFVPDSNFQLIPDL
ncbi:hypothetical protein OROMI_007442 [Orobanche minor]